MAIWVDSEQPGCCGGYSGWLRTTMVAFVSAGLGYGHKDFDGYRGPPGFCGGYRVWQRTTNMAFMATKALNASEFKCTEMFTSM